MRHSLIILINAITTAILLLIMACATGLATGMLMGMDRIGLGLIFMAVGFSLVFLIFASLAEDMESYQDARRAETADAHDWPFNHLKS